MIRSLHARTLLDLLLDRRQKVIDAIVSGANDYASYRQLVGEVQGIDDAIKLSEQADTDITNGGINAA